MFKRLEYLNQTYLRRDRIYRDYLDCIEWEDTTWVSATKKPALFPYRVYKRFIPVWLPAAEVAFWLLLFLLLVVALWWQ